MNRLEQFQARPVEKEFRGFKVKMRPLKVADYSFLQQFSNPESDKFALTIELLIKCIVTDDGKPLTKEEIMELELDIVNEITEEIMGLNKVDVDDAKAKLIEKLKAKQELKV